MKAFPLRSCLLLALCIPYMAPAVAEPKASDVELEKDLVFATIDGNALKYDMARPPEGEGPFPFIMCFHAGAWHLGDKKHYRDELREFAARGYVAVTVNYRFAPKYKWPAQLEDVQHALKYFRSRADELKIDPNRVGALGDDAGAHLALMLALTAAKEDRDPETPAPIQAAVSYFGPTDLRAWKEPNAWDAAKIFVAFQKNLARVMEDFVGGPDRSSPLYEAVSPVFHVSPGAPPILSIYGTDDPLVLPEHPKAFHEALRKAGVVEELMMVEGGVRHRLKINRISNARERMFEFFDEHLKGVEPKASR